MNEIEKIYKCHSRKKEKITIELERYMVDSYPTCLSFYGGDGIEPEICKLLMKEKYGTILVCGYSGDVLDYYMVLNYDFLTIPSDNCPLWGKLKNR